MLPSPKVGDREKICRGGGDVICGDVSENFGFPVYEIQLQNEKTTQTHIQDLVADMHSNQGTLEKRVNKIEEKLASMQSQLEGLPKVIAQSLIAHQQEQQDQRYLPADCGPTVRRFSPPSRRRRHFPVPLNNSSSQI